MSQQGKHTAASRPRRMWTDEQKAVLREHYPHRPTQAVAAMLGRPVAQVYNQACKLGLRKTDAYLATPDACRLRRGDEVGEQHRFRPGHVPANKGLCRPAGWAPGRMAETRFAKGSVPPTWVPVGSYTVNSDGYLDRKVADLRGRPRHESWKPVHRLVWEAAHGPAPAGHVVAFKPGRRSTELDKITLDAVELITRRELMARNSMHNLPKELALIHQLRGALHRAIKAKAKREDPST